MRKKIIFLIFSLLTILALKVNSQKLVKVNLDNFILTNINNFQEEKIKYREIWFTLQEEEKEECFVSMATINSLIEFKIVHKRIEDEIKESGCIVNAFLFEKIKDEHQWLKNYFIILADCYYDDGGFKAYRAKKFYQDSQEWEDEFIYYDEFPRKKSIILIIK